MNNWNKINIVPEFLTEGVACYKLGNADFQNSYYIVSEKDSRKLMMHPEVVGYEVYTSLLKPTAQMLNFLQTQNKTSFATILNILRGGLNFPIEEACYQNNINVYDISFLSSERVFDSTGNINGLAIKYDQVSSVDDSSLIIGDIIASGETAISCIRQIIKHYKKQGEKLRNIIVFTIGGTKAITLFENLTNEIRKYWPSFEGFITIFYEGVFSCYEPGDNGVSGINRPLIDYIWRDGIISPEFRRETLTVQNAIFEKCIIYDGGARRFNIQEHIEEVLEFWNGILKRSNKIDMHKLLEEKLGHQLPISYNDWVASCHYTKLPEEQTKTLYLQELKFLESLKDISLEQISQQRISEFTSFTSCYI